VYLLMITMRKTFLDAYVSDGARAKEQDLFET
jgi:hypothetical protein